MATLDNIYEITSWEIFDILLGGLIHFWFISENGTDVEHLDLEIIYILVQFFHHALKVCHPSWVENLMTRSSCTSWTTSWLRSPRTLTKIFGHISTLHLTLSRLFWFFLRRHNRWLIITLIIHTIWMISYVIYSFSWSLRINIIIRLHYVINVQHIKVTLLQLMWTLFISQTLRILLVTHIWAGFLVREYAHLCVEVFHLLLLF